ncbi:hypothetical protein, partial [Microcoleus sp. herbarium2]|uniref:hypothetical protein n=1 Tax=Microcoleus sp. herbarium2 TaxID=3055433 RepID=UPI002FD20DA3
SLRRNESGGLYPGCFRSTLGNPLFQRTLRRMVSTKAGQRLYTQIAGAIDKLESIPHKNSTA